MKIWVKKFLRNQSGRRLLPVLLISSFVLSSCSTLTGDITITSHMNDGINLKNYKTFDWNTNSQIAFDPIGQWEQPTLDTDVDVQNQIQKDLLKRGFEHSLDEPDLLVTYTAGVESELLKLSNNASDKNPTSNEIDKSSLVIAFTDAISGQTIWLAHADASPQEQQSIENIRKRIHFAIKEIFEVFEAQ